MSERIEFLRKLKLVKPVCIEIGVYEGVFSKIIFETLKPKKLVLVDPWENGSDKNGEEEKYSSGLLTAYSNDEEYKTVLKNLAGEMSGGRVDVIRGYSYEIIPRFVDEYFDFVYIDACHLYRCVEADLEMCLSKLKKKGWMCGHDYGEIFPGVKKAVDEFCERHGFKIIHLTKDGDFALRRQ